MKKLFLCLILFSACYQKSQALTYIFTGLYNSDWSNSMNWKSHAGMPGNVNLKSNTIIIEARCTIPQGLTITNYGQIVVKANCPRWDFHSINNYGKIEFEQTTFHQALGETFKNYAGGSVILSRNAISNFNRFINYGQVLEPDSLSIVSIAEWNRKE